MTRERKENITVYSAVSMLVFGCVLTTIAFFIEPMGEIHDSVLWVLWQSDIPRTRISRPVILRFWWRN